MASEGGVEGVCLTPPIPSWPKELSFQVSSGDPLVKRWSVQSVGGLGFCFSFTSSRSKHPTQEANSLAPGSCPWASVGRYIWAYCPLTHKEFKDQIQEAALYILKDIVI